jgi:hypothetical protein
MSKRKTIALHKNLIKYVVCQTHNHLDFNKKLRSLKEPENSIAIYQFTFTSILQTNDINLFHQNTY